jgi:hypothetical protein
VLRTLTRNTAQQLQEGLPQQWKWNGRNVFIADGSHVWMPDTTENQQAYPQPVVQQPGIGFPLARLAVLLSLASGACHDLAIAPYAGKGTGETTLLRQTMPGTSTASANACRTRSSPSSPRSRMPMTSAPSASSTNAAQQR